MGCLYRVSKGKLGPEYLIRHKSRVFFSFFFFFKIKTRRMGVDKRHHRERNIRTRARTRNEVYDGVPMYPSTQGDRRITNIVSFSGHFDSWIDG